MMKNDRSLRLGRLSALAAASLLLAQNALAAAPASGDAKRAQKAAASCQECHSCPTPRADKPCLKPCPSHASKESSQHKAAEAPSSMMLESLKDQFGPVSFDHGLHAKMSEMNSGCTVCHHFSPPGQIPPCSSCHGGTANPANLKQPSLKGAYHRICVSCHKEWSHDTSCAVCHPRNDKAKSAAAEPDKTDIMGTDHHPKLKAPEKKVYKVPYEAGKIVTFFHDEHVQLFGLKCTDCHRNESCSYCHDAKKPETLKKSQEQVHDTCNQCHKDDKCTKCHDSVERAPFSHASTGFPLGRYHAKLGCRSCHPVSKPIGKLSRECGACHGSWEPGKFKHAVVGLELDKRHAKKGCAECHPDKRYGAKPSCTNCHDEDMDYRKTPPGTRGSAPRKP